MHISLQNLSRSYRDAGRKLVVISDLSVEFGSGSSVAIVGRSGVGKSTLLHLIAGLDRADSGRVLCGGTDINSLSDDQRARFRAKNVGFIFQFHHLLNDFNAVENVAMPLLILGEGEREARKKAAEVLERVGLAERCSHRPGELSGGEQQRVAVARAVVVKPALLLADEPTGNLDLESGQEVEKLLLELNREQKSTLVIATHSKELAGTLGCAMRMLEGGGLEELS